MIREDYNYKLAKLLYPRNTIITSPDGEVLLCIDASEPPLALDFFDLNELMPLIFKYGINLNTSYCTMDNQTWWEYQGEYWEDSMVFKFKTEWGTDPIIVLIESLIRVLEDNHV